MASRTTTSLLPQLARRTASRQLSPAQRWLPQSSASTSTTLQTILATRRRSPLSSSLGSLSFTRAAHTIPRPRAPSHTSTTTTTTTASPADNKASSSSSSASANPPATTTTTTSTSNIGLDPHYELTFTCVPCGTRSQHRITKQGYHQGSVLITCPSCRNRHVISDHLGIFSSDAGAPKTVEDLVRARGGLVKKGTLGEDGDVEFWEDGTATVRAERLARAAGEGVVQPPPPSSSREAGRADDDVAPGSTFASGSSSGEKKSGI